MIKGKSLIEPGYEADSKFCAGCEKLCLIEGYFGCSIFVEKLPISQNVGFSDKQKRCQSCLESEVKQ